MECYNCGDPTHMLKDYKKEINMMRAVKFSMLVLIGASLGNQQKILTSTIEHLHHPGLESKISFSDRPIKHHLTMLYRYSIFSRKSEGI